MRYAYVADRTARARGPDRLHHGFLGADTFEHRVRTDAFGQFFDASYAVIPTFVHDVRRSKLFRELLSGLVSAHRNDPLRSHLLRGKHTEQAYGPIANDDDGRARLYIRRVSREPAGSEHIRGCKKAGNEIVRGKLRCGDERAVGQGDPSNGCLRSGHEFEVLASRLATGPTMRTRIVRDTERPDHELPGFNGLDRTSDLLNDSAIFVSHRRGLGDLLNAPIRPQVGAAYACG